MLRLSCRFLLSRASFLLVRTILIAVVLVCAAISCASGACPQQKGWALRRGELPSTREEKHLAVFFAFIQFFSTSTLTFSLSFFLLFSLKNTAAMLQRSLKWAAAVLALCAFAFVAAAAAADGAPSSSENEAATFAAAAPTAAATAAAATAAAEEEAPPSPSPSSSSLEAAPLDPTSVAIAAAAAAIDAATVDALLRIRAAVSPSLSDGGKKVGPEVADAAEAEAEAPGPLPAPGASAAAESSSGSGSSSSLARESQDAYRSYKGLVPGSRLARLAPSGAFPGSPPARAEAATPPALSGKATLTAPGEATGALLASLPPPSNAPAPSSSSTRGRGRRNPPSPAPSPGPRGDASGSKRIWRLTVDAAAERQAFEGFGTSLAWWALVVGSFAESVRNKVADLMFDASKGLGLEVVR